MSLDFSPARPRTARSPLALVLAVSVAAAAAPARASEGLELVPDFLTTLPILLAAFIAVTLVLDPLIFQPLLKVMDEREERIEGARRRADQVQQQAEEALTRYEQSIRAAHDEAAAARRTRLDEARDEQARMSRSAKKEAERDIASAREELSGSVVEARATLRESANDLATLAAERILGRTL
jgi:F-type H+-transporting ATPase subunit b